MLVIYPSLMAVTNSDIKDVIKKLQFHCAGFHIDIMDNQFVPNYGIPLTMVQEIIKITQSIWIHLMVENPIDFYMQLDLPKDTLVSFHIESKVDHLNLIKIIKENKHRSSIALNPKTSLDLIFPFSNIVDQILIMSVNPGFSYQQFLKDSLDRIIELNTYRINHNLSFRIGIDGGINESTIIPTLKNGVDDYVIGGGIFSYDNPLKQLLKLQRMGMDAK